MARIRTIKPEFPQSESMGQCTRDARLTFLLLFTMADDAGRLRGNSRMLASLLFPYDDDARKHIDTWLTELEKVGCIQRYQVDGDSFIAINKWSMHQKIDKPSQSKLPEPPEFSRILANALESSSKPAELPSAERKGKEGKGEEEVFSGFEEFWNTWPSNPRKQSKGECLKSWKKANAESVASSVISHVNFLKNGDWKKDDGKYIPAPLVYLNQKRWDGAELSSVQTSGILAGAI